MTDLPKKPLDEEAPCDAHNDDPEDGTIEALGYDVSYRRVLKTIANVCWVLALTSPVGAILVVASYMTTYGGFFGLIWGWIIPSVLLLPQVLAVGELCSSMPVNGATYWWTAALAPPSLSRSLSFISGCTTIVSLFTAVASFAYSCSAILVMCATLTGSSWTPTAAQQMAVAMGIVLIWVLGMSLQLDKLGWLMIVCTIIPLLQTLAYIIGLPATHAASGASFASASDVFGTYQNYSDWNPSVAVPMTWFAAVWTNSAWMTPAYMVEGTHNARRVAPKSMMLSYIITAVVGTIMCIISAFCVSDIDTLGMDYTGYPLVTLMYEHWGESATVAFILAGAIAAVVSGCGWVLSFSFQLSAYSRDGGLPLAKYLTYVHPRTNTPIYAAGTLAFGSILILLLALSAIAKSVIYSLAVIVSLMTLALPIGLRLCAGDRWVPGPWNLGAFSKPVHAWALLIQIYLIVMESFPSQASWTLDTFNYIWALALGTVGLSTILYLVFGSSYKGIDLEALAKYRQEQQASNGVTEIPNN